MLIRLSLESRHERQPERQTFSVTCFSSQIKSRYAERDCDASERKGLSDGLPFSGTASLFMRSRGSPYIVNTRSLSLLKFLWSETKNIY